MTSLFKLNTFKIVAILLFHWSYNAMCLQQSFHCPFAKWNQEFDLHFAPAINTEIDDLKVLHNEKSNNQQHTESIETWLEHFDDFYSKTTDYNRIHKNFNAAQHNRVNLQCAVPPQSCSTDESNRFYRSIDGSCNNIDNPGYGMAFSRYMRLIPPKYGDRIYSPTLSVTGESLPNPRFLSLALYGEKTVPDEYRTVAGMQWGQLVGHDVSKLSTEGAPDDCCTGIANERCIPIDLQPFGPIYTGTRKSCMHFARSTSDEDAACPRSGLPYVEKISIVTGYMDLSSIYGNSLEQSLKVREFRGGLLKISTLNNQHLLPISVNKNGDCGKGTKCFTMPDMRNQIVPTLAVLHTILAREHNRIAAALERMNPHFADEKLFQEARKLNIAQYQKITYYDWLPLIIGPTYAHIHGLIHHVLPHAYVQDYDNLVNAAPYAEFSSAAFRYLHNQIPGWFSLVGASQNETLPLRDFLDRPENVNVVVDQFNSIVRGLVTQLQKQTDDNIDKEIKHYFERKPFEVFGSDLKSIDIQRARDFGVPSYNDFREYCGLPRANEWSGFHHEIPVEKVDLMQQLYMSPNDVDLSVGGSFEIHAPESVLGPTFQCIIGRQFLKSRIGDRFFFERENVYSGFTRAQLREIRKATLSGLICNNVDSIESIQINAFLISTTRNILTNCDSIPKVDLVKWHHIQYQ